MASEPVRVAHLITGLEVGGAETMLARLIGCWDRTMVESTVISLTKLGPMAEKIAAHRARVVSLDMRSNRVNLGAMIHLVRILRTVRPHVLQTWLYHADLMGVFAGTMVRIPALVWNIRCSHLDFRDYSPTLPLVLRTLALTSRRPAAVVCNSTAGQRVHIELGYRPRRWEVIPNGVDTDAVKPCAEARDELRRDLRLAPTTPLVGLVGRLHPMKDHPTYLRAALLVHHELPDAHFLAVGRGVATSEMLRALVADLGLEDRVHLQDERPDAARILAGLDVAVSSSVSGEGFPNVVIEAMASGVPCVVTDVGDSAAIVAHTGIVVPPGDTTALAKGVLSVLSLPEHERVALAMAARDRAVNDFSLRVVAERYQSLYEEFAGRDSGAAPMIPPR
jgi:glycosyltransferase involved in cell wall biosynthesis